MENGKRYELEENGNASLPNIAHCQPFKYCGSRTPLEPYFIRGASCFYLISFEFSADYCFLYELNRSPSNRLYFGFSVFCFFFFSKRASRERVYCQSDDDDGRETKALPAERKTEQIWIPYNVYVYRYTCIQASHRWTLYRDAVDWCRFVARLILSVFLFHFSPTRFVFLVTVKLFICPLSLLASSRQCHTRVQRVLLVPSDFSSCSSRARLLLRVHVCVRVYSTYFVAWSRFDRRSSRSTLVAFRSLGKVAR